MSEPAPAAPDSVVVATQAAPPGTAADPAATPAGPGAAILALQRVGLDWWAVILGAVAVLIAVLGILPSVPWDDVNLPTFRW